MELYRLSVEERQLYRCTRHQDINARDATLIEEAIREGFGLSDGARILDLGCGKGGMVTRLASSGFEAYGCDVSPAWVDNPPPDPTRLAQISLSPYRLPYEADVFDLVFSTSVLEHVHDPETVMREVHRVLRPGGVSLHLFPSKWYLPQEPHIRIPLLNWFWPTCPRSWIRFWLFVRGLIVPEIAPYKASMLEHYCQFCKNDVVYLSNRRHRQIALGVFGNNQSLMDFYVARAQGGFGRLARRLPFRRVSAWFGGVFRMNMVYQRKTT